MWVTSSFNISPSNWLSLSNRNLTRPVALSKLVALNQRPLTLASWLLLCTTSRRGSRMTQAENHDPLKGLLKCVLSYGWVTCGTFLLEHLGYRPTTSPYLYRAFSQIVESPHTSMCALSIFLHHRCIHIPTAYSINLDANTPYWNPWTHSVYVHAESRLIQRRTIPLWWLGSTTPWWMISIQKFLSRTPTYVPDL